MLGLALTAGLLAVLFRGLAEARNVTTETISQAFSGYLLIAIAFGQFYSILNFFIPGAFNPAAPTGAISIFIYFSFSTITSVGFGDVTPLDPFVRIVAAMEATTGIFYQTVVVARLVSLYIPRHALQPPPDPARQPEGKPLPSGDAIGQQALRRQTGSEAAWMLPRQLRGKLAAKHRQPTL